MLKTIPLRPEWTGSTAPDLRAIYKRRKQDNFGEAILDAEGREQWDTTGPLPLRQHAQWHAKGFVYVTLADEASLGKVAGVLRSEGLDPASFMQDRRTRSPFNAAMWLEDQAASEGARLVELRGLVAEFGREAVEKMRGPLPAVLLAELATKRAKGAA